MAVYDDPGITANDQCDTNELISEQDPTAAYRRVTNWAVEGRGHTAPKHDFGHFWNMPMVPIDLRDAISY